MSAAVVVCADLDTARAAMGGGDHVVLIGGDAADVGAAAARLRAEGGEESRISVFVGDPSDAAVWATAATMAAEQFRCDVHIERARQRRTPSRPPDPGPRPPSGEGQVP